MLSCSNSESWPSRVRCLVSVVTQVPEAAGNFGGIDSINYTSMAGAPRAHAVLGNVCFLAVLRPSPNVVPLARTELPTGAEAGATADDTRAGTDTGSLRHVRGWEQSRDVAVSAQAVAADSAGVPEPWAVFYLRGALPYPDDLAKSFKVRTLAALPSVFGTSKTRSVDWLGLLRRCVCHCSECVCDCSGAARFKPLSIEWPWGTTATAEPGEPW